MKNNELKALAEKIASDVSREIGERAKEILRLRDKAAEDCEESEALMKDLVAFNVMVDMVKRENESAVYDAELMELYKLLAQTYVRLNDYRALGDVAMMVLDIMRKEEMTAEEYKEVVPEIAEAVEYSVYNHYLYEILLRYVRKCLKKDPMDMEVKPQAELMLRLHLLVEKGDWRDDLWNKAFQTAVAGLFTSVELLHIIQKPEPGHLRKDPVEYTWRWEEVYYDVEDEINRLFPRVRRHMGMCFRIWDAKQDILKNRYGIEWRTPSQMNPRVMFD